jgi:hypothetical protein
VVVYIYIYIYIYIYSECVCMSVCARERVSTLGYAFSLVFNEPCWFRV